jgi:hypothetical protein
MLTQTYIVRLESAAILAAERSRPGAVLILTGARDALVYAEHGSQWLRRQIDRLIAALAEPARALDCADAPDTQADAMRSPAPCAEPLDAPAAARQDETPAPAPVKRRGRPPKAKPVAAAEPMAEPAEMPADAPPAEMAEPIAPAIPVPETAGAHPIVETAGDEPPVPPKPRRGRKPKAVATIEAPAAEPVTAPPADTPVVETADYTPVPQMAGPIAKPLRRGRKPKAAKPVKINLSHLRKNNSTLNSRMAGDAESGNDATIQKAKYAARILQKRGLLPDDVSRFSASWDHETQTVTFHDYKTREIVRYQIPAYVMSYDPTKALVSIETDPAPEVSNLSDARRREPARHLEGEALPIAA